MPNFVETDRMALQASFDPAAVERPTIVCLCGSTKFWRTFQRAGLQETMKGNIVLSIGAAAGTDDEHFGNLKPEVYEAIKDKLDVLHYHKIAMTDEILVLDELKDGRPYIGTSTAAEIAFATRMGKRVRYWSEENPIIPKVKIVVASTSQIKLDAVKDIFRSPFVQIVGCKATSGVREQPFGDKEIYQGAVNRLDHAKELEPGAGLYIAIENGIYFNQYYYDVAYVLFYIPKSNRMFMIESGPVKIPDKYIFATQSLPGGFETNTVGQAMVASGDYPGMANDDPHQALVGTPRQVFLQEAVRNGKAQLDHDLLRLAITGV